MQRDLLPMIEGSSVTTRHGNIDTSFILFIASGAFHSCKPSDMLAELQASCGFGLLLLVVSGVFVRAGAGGAAAATAVLACRVCLVELLLVLLVLGCCARVSDVFSRAGAVADALGA